MKIAKKIEVNRKSGEVLIDGKELGFYIAEEGPSVDRLEGDEKAGVYVINLPVLVEKYIETDGNETKIFLTTEQTEFLDNALKQLDDPNPKTIFDCLCDLCEERLEDFRKSIAPDLSIEEFVEANALTVEKERRKKALKEKEAGSNENK